MQSRIADMDTYLYSELTDCVVPGVLTLPGSDKVKGKQLVSVEKLGFTCYEVQSAAGTRFQAVTPPAETNHLYYCMDGECQAMLDNGTRYLMTRNCLLALPPGLKADFKVHSGLRLLVMHVDSVTGDKTKPQPIFRTISDLVGGERDVDWQRGRSRRFLVQADGFNISVHDTIAYANNTSPLLYENNHEFCYYVRGMITYRWAGDKTCSFSQDDQSIGDGLTVIIPKGEAHEVEIGSREVEGVCVFFPALRGTETHDFTKEGHSAY